MNYQQLGRDLDAFARARGWQVHHLSRSLLLALTKEVGEAAELLQWVPDDQVDGWFEESENREKFAGELADVLIYLHYLSRSAGVDLEQAVAHKIELNETRFPKKRM